MCQCSPWDPLVTLFRHMFRNVQAHSWVVPLLKRLAVVLLSTSGLIGYSFFPLIFFQRIQRLLGASVQRLSFHGDTAYASSARTSAFFLFGHTVVTLLGNYMAPSSVDWFLASNIARSGSCSSEHCWTHCSRSHCKFWSICGKRVEAHCNKNKRRQMTTFFL